MNLRKFLLLNAAGSDGAAAGGGTPAPADAGSTVLTGDAPNTSATGSAAPAAAGATQQPSADDAAAKAATEADAAAAADKPEGDKPAGEKTAPEKYEFKAPEGVTLDPEALGEFEGLARELKLSQEDAQKVTDIGAKLAQKWEAKQAQVIQQAAAEWATAVVADKEIGGDNVAANLAVAKKALDAFGTPELRDLLNGSRLGNHPEVVRFMYRAGKAISEDRMVTGGKGPAAEVSTAKALYPNQS